MGDRCFKAPERRLCSGTSCLRRVGERGTSMAGTGPNAGDCLAEAATLDIEETPNSSGKSQEDPAGLDTEAKGDTDPAHVGRAGLFRRKSSMAISAVNTLQNTEALRMDREERFREVREIRRRLAPGADRAGEGWFSLRASTKDYRKTTSRTKKHGDMEWDIFLSYRVDADAELVKELYWQLRNMTITENGKTRPLRVFWDRECLKDGEKWEEGFAKAICSSKLVVLVMSRNTFKMEGRRHNVEALAEDSPADNVLLEYELGLCLNELHGTAIMPLFVGDKDDSGKYSHFFESKCMPACKEVTVKSISEKVSNYLENDAGVAPEDLTKRYRPRSVSKIMSDVTQFQSFFVQGPAYEAVKGAVLKMHACANRLAQEHVGRQQLEHLQFSTPQGEEVCQFLAEKTLSSTDPSWPRISSVHCARSLSSRCTSLTPSTRSFARPPASRETLQLPSLAGALRWARLSSHSGAIRAQRHSRSSWTTFLIPTSRVST